MAARWDNDQSSTSVYGILFTLIGGILALLGIGLVRGADALEKQSQDHRREKRLQEASQARQVRQAGGLSLAEQEPQPLTLSEDLD
jgi:hypothetical protein